MNKIRKAHIVHIPTDVFFIYQRKSVGTKKHYEQDNI